MGEKKRVVLVEPGDVLLIGGVSPLTDETVRALGEFFAANDISVALFEEGIDISKAEGMPGEV